MQFQHFSKMKKILFPLLVLVFIFSFSCNAFAVDIFIPKTDLELCRWLVQNRSIYDFDASIFKLDSIEKIMVEVQKQDRYAAVSYTHLFCLNLLHLYFYHLNLDPAFQIAKEAEMDLLKEDVLETLLEEKYQEEDAIYLDLVACYGGKEDEQLKNFLLQLYEYSCSFPQPIDWLEQLAAQFAAPLTEDTAWVKDCLLYTSRCV